MVRPGLQEYVMPNFFLCLISKEHLIKDPGSFSSGGAFLNFQIPIKVKPLLNRPGQALRIPGGWGSQISKQSACKGGKVSPTHRTPLPRGKYSWYSFLLETECILVPQCGRKDYANEKFQRESNPRPSDLQRSISTKCATACPANPH
jgi:hypothetical protein